MDFPVVTGGDKLCRGARLIVDVVLQWGPRFYLGRCSPMLRAQSCVKPSFNGPSGSCRGRACVAVAVRPGASCFNRSPVLAGEESSLNGLGISAQVGSFAKIFIRLRDSMNAESAW